VAKRLSGIKAKFVVLLATAMLAVPFLIASASPASAHDANPCGPVYWIYFAPGYSSEVQVCPLWTAPVPVYSAPSQSTSKVGWLYSASGNWFICQEYWSGAPSTAHYGPYYNNWWAFTQADNGQWGWVPEVFFKGGGNNEPDATLRAGVWCGFTWSR
jgi:hypothetical protein